MQKIFSIQDILSYEINFENIKNEFTAVIAAAGRGSRLNFEKPKILFPILNKTLIDIIYEKMNNYCKEFIIVVSLDGFNAIQSHIIEKSYKNIKLEIQKEPLGMADAIYAGINSVNTQKAIVLWGDQVTFSVNTLEMCIRLSTSNSNYSAIFPTIEKLNPYIHFERDEFFYITKVLQARENDLMPARGESDCGLFIFRKDSLSEVLLDHYFSSIGNVTSEWNFLPLLPFFEKKLNGICTLQIDDLNECIGINDRSDAILVTNILQNEIGKE